MQIQQQEQSYEKIIEKNGLTFIKLTPNKFNLTFDVNNRNIMLPSIINFELIQLINKLNPNIFDSITTNDNDNDNDNDTNTNFNILLKDIFSDLGLPQYYLALNIHKYDYETNKIVFKCESLTNKLNTYPDDVELLPIQSINIHFNIINNHSIKINCDIDLINKHNIPLFSEKIIGNIIYNIFNRLKQFIEKVSF
jgi:hypothetical protein